MYLRGRRRAFDGLRALAVATVFLVHAGEHMPGGFYGVDVFFVLSGFLITTLLLAEHRETGRIDLREFYIRRARRLLPALVCMIVIVSVIEVSTSTFHGPLWPSVLVVLLYVGNWAEAFGHTLGGGLMTHTWSLSIEEQFYLVWPIVIVFGLRRHWASVRLFFVALVPAVSSYLLRSVVWRPGPPGERHTTFAYFATPTHADGILLGSALAIALSDARMRRVLSFLSQWAIAALALVVIVAAAAFDGDGHAFVWGAVILSAGAIVGHVATVEASPVERLLSVRPLVWVGERSYGIYLYHFVIFFGIFAPARWSTTVPGPVDTVMLGIASLVVASVSYRFVETPFRRRRRTAPASKVVLAQSISRVASSVRPRRDFHPNTSLDAAGSAE
jgi:peptidoglycan/LPS O-acetylase OafA/YrhL